MNYNIAIDGPASAGKSTVAKALAKKLNYVYVDTGSMYRAISVYVNENNIDYTNDSEVIASLENISISLKYDNKNQLVILNGVDITGKLREEQIGTIASIVAVIPEVRKKLVSIQRELAKNENVVMDGRDIGTVVLPNANVKVYLDASAEIRAKRRVLELELKGIKSDYDEIYEDIKMRDHRDMTRETSPLKIAENAVVIDSSNLNQEEVLEKIIELVK